MNFIKKKIAAVLVVCLFLGLLPCGMVWARGKVEVDRECTITVKAPDTWEDLLKTDFDVKLYRVASIDKDGVYTADEKFSVIANELSAVDHTTTAKAWADMAAKVAEVVSKGSISEDYTVQVKNGVGVVTGVQTGLYLVHTDEVIGTGYGYSFTPYLVSAPNNEFASTGEGSDSWIYDDIVIGLKPEQYQLKGDLEIVKTLKTHNSSLGTQMFVFDIQAFDKDNNVIYSNVVSIAFDAAGKRKVVVKDLPAGARVVVTEVYSGASYEVVTSPTQETVILADEMMSVEFSNDYNDELVYGTGVVNHFEYDGNGFEWHQIPDNQ